MYADMEFWTEVRRRVLTGELSKRGACREYDLSWPTLARSARTARSPTTANGPTKTSRPICASTPMWAWSETPRRAAEHCQRRGAPERALGALPKRGRVERLGEVTGQP